MCPDILNPMNIKVNNPKKPIFIEGSANFVSDLPLD